MSSLRFIAGYPSWFVLLLVIVAGAFSFWSYRRTTPPVPRFWRIILFLARWAALIGAIILIARPAIEWRKRSERVADLAILLDRSASMGVGGTANKAEQVKALISGGAFSRLARRAHLTYHTFADSLTGEYEDLTVLMQAPPTGGATDLVRSWEQVFHRTGGSVPQGIILISDGDWNSGSDPARLARLSPAPIWTLGVGSDEATTDLAISRVTAGPTVYQGSQVPVEIGMEALGAAGKSISLSLQSAGKIVDRRIIQVTGGYFESVAQFTVPAEKPGKQRFVAVIDTMSGEVTYDNNRRSFYLNVLPSRMRVLLLAGPPDFSLGDLVRRLRHDEHIELITCTAKDGYFYEGGWPADTALAHLDAVILHHFPVKGLAGDALAHLSEEIKRLHLPVCFFDGGDTDYRLLAQFEPVLPVAAHETRAAEVAGQATPLKHHAIIAPPEESDFSRGWNRLPPLRYVPGLFSVKPGAETLAEFRGPKAAGESPALVISEIGGGKGAAILGRDTWRWGLAEAEEDSLWERMIGRLIRWLAVRRVDKPVRMDFDKDVFTLQEPVGFTVSVYDQTFQPIDDASISVTASRPGSSGGAVTVESAGQGRYRGSFTSWGEGEYRIAVAASRRGELVGRDSGAVAVEPFSIELLNTRLNDDLLKAVAANSGGVYAPAGAADSLLDSINPPPIVNEEAHRIDPWGKMWLLIGILAMLTLEWAIRIRLGML